MRDIRKDKLHRKGDRQYVYVPLGWHFNADDIYITRHEKTGDLTISCLDRPSRHHLHRHKIIIDILAGSLLFLVLGTPAVFLNLIIRWLEHAQQVDRIIDLGLHLAEYFAFGADIVVVCWFILDSVYETVRESELTESILSKLIGPIIALMIGLMRGVQREPIREDSKRDEGRIVDAVVTMMGGVMSDAEIRRELRKRGVSNDSIEQALRSLRGARL
jgi:hypothetical protein